MSEGKEVDLKILTVEEANRLLPQVREILKAIRQKEREILSKQAQVDLEEMIGSRPDGSLTEGGSHNRDQKLSELNKLVHDFYKKVNELEELGGVLKDLKKGLVDFYSVRHGSLVFLCWADGEEKIDFWHSLHGGYATRQSL